MAKFFVDSSALVKRYMNESGTRWVRGWTKSSTGNIIVIAELTLVEMFSVFARRAYEKDMTTKTVDRLRGIFLGHVKDDYLVVRISGAQLAVAQSLVTTHVALGLRSLDAIQLATALQAQRTFQERVTFVSADKKLLKAATAEQFDTDDPYLHS